jgi:hypothetical protein
VEQVVVVMVVWSISIAGNQEQLILVEVEVVED